MLPSGKRAKNARSISWPSLRQHYLVAMATSLDKLENKVQIHHRHIKSFHMVKRLGKLVQYIRDIWRNTLNHDTISIRLFFAKTIDRLSPKFYTRYIGISGVIKSCIYTALSHSVSECQSDESVEFAIFSQNRLPWQRSLPWDIGKRGPRGSSALKTQKRWKDCENRSSRCWDHLSPRYH